MEEQEKDRDRIETLTSLLDRLCDPGLTLGESETLRCELRMLLDLADSTMGEVTIRDVGIASPSSCDRHRLCAC